ncbi:three-helix bundle dimerization domain-containing protein [Kibdelosporangium banguiense]
MPHHHTIDELTRQFGAYLAGVQDRLLERYKDIPADRIRQYTKAEAERFADMPVQAFVPILVERAVRNRLEHEGVSQ